ncbi:MAG: UDP-N-acetylmuramoyl-L-alanine--D-glutamate ligase, partial [Epsilonproteobacteria bacterium]|nr:UDP-N-acetylmuramoyl-L-alanine--D-glutamate ligase [Campylobacterota bacterium]
AIIPKAYANTPTKAKLYTYEDAIDLAEQFGIDVERVNFEGAFLLDALLAMTVDKLMNDRLDYETMNTFRLDPHRQEELHDSHGRLWVNDTKATNLDATIAAVKRYEDRFIHLILGGDDKGVDLSGLFHFLQDKQLQIYTIGSNQDKLTALAKKHGIGFVRCNNLVDALKDIDTALQKDQVALLSPAASSLDQFNSYAQRGEVFKQTVNKL